MIVVWVILGGLVVAALITVAALTMLPAVARRMVKILLTHPMSDTLAELYLSVRSTPLMDFLYASLRSATGDIVIRPMGSAKPAHGFDDLAFTAAQLARRPILLDKPVDLATTLGGRAQKPLTFSMPIFISGMAYGLALNQHARLALAEASARAQIPINSGQGPFLEEERAKAYRYILQFGRWVWNRDPEVLRRADMIEVQVGQGAMPGNAVLASPTEVGPEIKALMHLGPTESPIIHADLFLKDPSEPTPLKEVVAFLRETVPDVPIALKMGADDLIEENIDVALDAKIDVLVIDGTEGATGNAPITLSDHFGIPTLYALIRARHHLEARGAWNQVDLVVSGGLREPGDFLKAVALGAKAVGIGTIAMFALAHQQITEAVPLYPPTDLVFYRAQPKLPLDVKLASQGLYNFLESCRKEMMVALRTVGVSDVHHLRRDDLSALDPTIARVTGLHFAGDPRSPTE